MAGHQQGLSAGHDVSGLKMRDHGHSHYIIIEQAIYESQSHDKLIYLLKLNGEIT